MRKTRLFLSLIALALVALLIFGVVSAVRAYHVRQLTGPLDVITNNFSSDLLIFPAGDFEVILENKGQGAQLGVVYRSDPERRYLWQSLPGMAFVAAAQGSETVEEARGSYFISDRLARTCTRQTLEQITMDGDAVVVAGQLECSGGTISGYSLTFYAASENQLSFHLSTNDPALNRTYLTYTSSRNEDFFGFGEQFSYFNHKGKRVPVWVSEQGIGRGLQPVTFLVNLVARSGGSPYTTYAAVPHYITSQMRSLFLENAEYSFFDLRRRDRVQVSVFSTNLRGRILYGESPVALIEEYTAWAGRMRPLPDWILDGAVIGMQGGTEKVRRVWEQLQAQDTPVAAFWLQDWVGQRTTSFGKQLWWNWVLDEERYPGWDALREDLQAQNIRVMVYASPFLADVSERPNLHRSLFAEAQAAGYLVSRPDGGPYLIQNTDFSAGLVDLTNPAAREWFEAVLRDELVENAGASGWMADFAEALPYDAVLYDGTSAASFHNRYPEAWAQLNRDLVDSLKDGSEVVFFTRAAFQRSPGYTTLMWTGDQLVIWDRHDGIKSAVTGMLSGGMSGFSLNHSDIGGYTGINNPLLKITRDKELLLRWMELSAFTTVYRTHEGNLPDLHAQFYDDEESLAQFSRMAKVYQAWGFLRKKLVTQAAETGLPVLRHPFLHYPEDAQARRLRYEVFLVGPDLLFAPVLDPGKSIVRAYLPAGSWVHVWSGAVYGSETDGQWVTVAAPLGEPAVFVKQGSPDGEQFIQNLRAAGLMP